MRVVSFALIASVVLSSACRSRPGSSCERGEARCVDKKSQLICQNGSYILAPCKGPRGCGLAPTGVFCDIRGNVAGDACSTDEEGASACTNEKTKIVCQAGKFVSSQCRGPKGCETRDGRPLCDTTIAEPGDPCNETDGSKGCSVDGKQYLSCKGGKMTMLFQCLGPNGCKSEAGKLSCDMSYARDKDPCLPEMEGKVACNLDHSSIVMCKGGKFVIDEECKEGKRCAGEGSIRCEKPEKKRD